MTQQKYTVSEAPCVDESFETFVFRSFTDHKQATELWFPRGDEQVETLCWYQPTDRSNNMFLAVHNWLILWWPHGHAVNVPINSVVDGYFVGTRQRVSNGIANADGQIESR